MMRRKEDWPREKRKRQRSRMTLTDLVVLVGAIDSGVDGLVPGDGEGAAARRLWRADLLEASPIDAGQPRRYRSTPKGEATASMLAAILGDGRVARLVDLAGKYCAADPKGGAAEWLEDDAESHWGFAENDPREREECEQKARESEAGAALLRAALEGP